MRFFLLKTERCHDLARCRRYVPQASCLLLLLASQAAFGETGFSNTNRPVSLLVNSQGWAQRDLSIRGSSYTGAGISVNGLNLKVPYSAHFNSELPMSGNWLSAPSVRQNTVAYTTVPQASSLQKPKTELNTVLFAGVDLFELIH